jgi:hypothetical protein
MRLVDRGTKLVEVCPCPAWLVVKVLDDWEVQQKV